LPTQQAPTTAAVTGASAVRESLDAARRTAPTAARDEPVTAGPYTDDAAVSADDDDVEVSTDVGRSVIEKVLGGRVISESND
jgi:DNA polymerase-3 subunit gamma/tau